MNNVGLFLDDKGINDFVTLSRVGKIDIDLKKVSLVQIEKPFNIAPDIAILNDFIETGCILSLCLFRPKTGLFYMITIEVVDCVKMHNDNEWITIKKVGDVSVV